MKFQIRETATAEATVGKKKAERKTARSLVT
jgi:hypothetical protein